MFIILAYLKLRSQQSHYAVPLSDAACDALEDVLIHYTSWPEIFILHPESSRVLPFYINKVESNVRSSKAVSRYCAFVPPRVACYTDRFAMYDLTFCFFLITTLTPSRDTAMLTFFFLMFLALNSYWGETKSRMLDYHLSSTMHYIGRSFLKPLSRIFFKELTVAVGSPILQGLIAYLA